MIIGMLPFLEPDSVHRCVTVTQGRTQPPTLTWTHVLVEFQRGQLSGQVPLSLNSDLGASIVGHDLSNTSRRFNS